MERVIQAAIIVAGIGAFAYLVTLNLPPSLVKLVIASCAIGFVGLVWGTSAFFDAKRRREIAESLTRIGLTVGKPAEARFIHRLLKGQRGLEGKFWANGTAAGGPLEIAEFIYKTGSGKHTQIHRNMQVSRPCPAGWPEFRLSKRLNIMRRNLLKLGAEQDFGLENEAFGKRWSIECADKDFVLLLLSPLVQDWLMLASKDESWTIAEGRVCVTRTRKCYAEETAALVTRLDEFIAMAPPELAAW